ncbi:MAG: hypothetical protein J1F31_03180 [Erysipelotrichales bacterium]|nr:hypothetical protein [Erysipelotrichales bacterium]
MGDNNSLLDFLNNEYSNLLKHGIPLEIKDEAETKSFSELIKDENLCLDFVYKIYEFSDTKSQLNKHRASHIIVNWLMGIGLDRVLKLPNHSGLQSLFFSQLWLQTSIIHDYGYFCKEIREKNVLLKKITDKYDLLIDYYDVDFLKCLNNFSDSEEMKNCLTYKYDLIRNYFEYSKEYHKDDYNETCDHGIVGGCLAFKRYCENIKKAKNAGIEPSDVITKIQKMACIVAASHNIYKSADKSQDEIYIENKLCDILSTSEIKITRSNKLLLILSLVDTIECTKRFSAKKDPKNYLIQTTTLKYVDIFIENNVIKLDYSRLYEYITKTRKSDEMKENLDKHIKGIKNLPNWTEFEIENVENNNHAVCIRCR